jgi:hypothetical protein
VADKPGITGTYRRTKPTDGTLRILHDGQFWLIWIVAPGAPNGDQTAANCSVVAEGFPREKGLEGQVLDAYDIERATTRRVLILFEGQTAHVLMAQGGCGLGWNGEGDYVRAD